MQLQRKMGKFSEPREKVFDIKCKSKLQKMGEK